jgi:hypothetical protein
MRGERSVDCEGLSSVIIKPREFLSMASDDPSWEERRLFALELQRVDIRLTTEEQQPSVE